MSTTAVLLVSDQTMQNVLFVKEFPPADRYVFLSTKQMEDKRRSELIRKACNEIPVSKFDDPLILIAEDGLSEISAQLMQKFELNDDESFVVNLTGGTKIMSIAAYDFFSRRNSKLFYLTAGKNTYTQVFPQVRHNENKLKYRVNLQEYLDAHGVSSHGGGLCRVFNNLDSHDFLTKYLNFGDLEYSMLDTLRSQDYRNKKSISVDSVPGLGDFLRRVHLQPNTPGKLNKHEVRYLTGDWLEDYVYHLIKNHYFLPDNAIATGLQIGSVEETEDAGNELDVVFVYNNKIYLIECKTSMRSGEDDILNDTLYKSAALRIRFGLLVSTYIFTLDEASQLREGYDKRSKLMGVPVLERETVLSSEKLSAVFRKG